MDTKKLRQKILDLAIRGKLVPQDPNDEPASVLLERIRAEKEQLIKEGKIKRSKKSAASDTSHYENYELPQGWTYATMGDICIKIVDGDHNPPIAQKTESKYIMISSKNVINNSITHLDDVRYLSKADFELSNARTQVSKGDVLFTSVASLGRTCIYDLDYPITFQRSVTVICTKIFNKYLKLFLDSPIYQNYVVENARGTAQKGFYINQISDSWVPIPPLNEQIRIVEKAQSLLDVVQIIEYSKEEISNNILALKSKILDLAISGKLVRQVKSDEPAIELLKRINAQYQPTDNRHYENIPFELPETWLWVTLSDISNYGECANVSVDKISNESWVLELEDIEKDSGSLLQRMRKSDRTINGVRHSFQKGDVLYSKLRTYLNKVLVADQDGYCTTEIIPITCVPGIVPEYLCHVLRSRYYVDYTISLGYGVKMPRLGTADALKSMIPVPPYEEQRRIVKSVNEIYHKLEQISSEL